MFVAPGGALWATSHGVILRSTDDGVHWSQSFPPAPTAALDFLNTTEGYAIGSEGVLRTTDGGASWLSLPGMPGVAVSALRFTNTTDGWALGQTSSASGGRSVVLRTTDGGQTWSVVYNGPQGTDDVAAMAFFGPEQGIQVVEAPECAPCGLASAVWETRNGGQQWTQGPALPSGGFQSASIVSAQQIFGVTLGGFGAPDALYASTTGGTTWRALGTLPTQLGLAQVAFVSPTTGWVCGTVTPAGTPSASPEGVLLRTTDGGSHWNAVTLPDVRSINSIFFINSGIGWLTSQTGLWRTTDGGDTWVEIA